MPSPELRDLLRKTFGVKKPKEVAKPIALPIHQDAPEYKRSVGDVNLSAEAQKIYSGGPLLPSTPMTQPIKPPTTQQTNRGTVGGMSMQGPWGQTPEGK
jgi:hypothetical protein